MFDNFAVFCFECKRSLSSLDIVPAPVRYFTACPECGGLDTDDPSYRCEACNDEGGVCFCHSCYFRKYYEGGNYVGYQHPVHCDVK